MTILLMSQFFTQEKYISTFLKLFVCKNSAKTNHKLSFLHQNNWKRSWVWAHRQGLVVGPLENIYFVLAASHSVIVLRSSYILCSLLLGSIYNWSIYTITYTSIYLSTYLSIMDLYIQSHIHLSIYLPIHL